MSSSKNPVQKDKERAPDADCKEHRENLLDDALDDTFPASDPPAIVAPTSRRC
ncbi:MAG TPA: hypothetical protein VKY80_10660 [Croceibacterium sp.]|nr:hypothetical protein [Croceibacterium sp.]